MSPSVKLIVQLHDTLSLLLSHVITNVVQLIFHVALLQLVTLAVIVSQLHALAHKSLTTLLTVLLPVITHKFLLVVVTCNATSCHVNVAFLLLVTFHTASLTNTATV